MNLQMHADIANGYNSNSQRIRVITENWANQNLYCPYCGNDYIHRFENNRPVADFYCPHCAEEYELKSKSGAIGKKVSDGAYETMIERIRSINNPSLFVLQYNKPRLAVENVFIIPKHFWVTDAIEKRKPLSPTARRAGWVGCSILVSQIPEEGKIFLVKNKEQLPVDSVLQKIQKTSFIANYRMDARGWILDILNCIHRIPDTHFSLDKMYAFEDELALKHPENHHIKDKIRQQLQVLRDKEIIEFCGQGNYKKLG